MAIHTMVLMATRIAILDLRSESACGRAFISKPCANQHVYGTRNNLKLDRHFIDDFPVESKTHTRRG